MSDNKTTKTIIMLRHDTKENWDNSELVLKTGEVGIDTTNNMLKVGDGINKYEDLPYLTTDNVLTLNTEQTITGQKTFRNLIVTNREYEPYDDCGIRFSTDEIGYSGEISIDSDVGSPTSYGVHGVSYNGDYIDFEALLNLLNGDGFLTAEDLVTDGKVPCISLGPDEGTYTGLDANGMNINYSFYGLETSTVYCNGFIQYFDRDGTSGEDIINADSKLLFPSQSGTLATQEWTSENVVTLDTAQTITGSKLFKRQLVVGDPDNPESSEDLYPKMQLKSPMGTITIGHEGTEVAPGIYVDNAGTKTRYDAMSIETMSGRLDFPQEEGTFATQEFVESYVEDKLSNSSESSTDSSFADGLVTITKDSTGEFGLVTVKGATNDVVVNSESITFGDSEGTTVYGRNKIKAVDSVEGSNIEYRFPTDETGTHTIATRSWSQDNFALLSDVLTENRRIKAELSGEVTLLTLYISGELGYDVSFSNLVGVTEIDWGDGTVESGKTSHTYSSVGEYRCKIYGLTSIGESAFVSVGWALNEIIISKNVTSIGTNAFQYCSLTDVNILSGVTSIGQSAFLGCASLSSIILGEGLVSIGDDAFRGCSKLSSIIIPSTVTSIGKNAFLGSNANNSGAGHRNEIVIPSSVEELGGEYVFGNWRLIRIQRNTPPTITGSSLSVDSTTKILVPRNMKTLYTSAEGWSNYASQIYEDVQYAIETSEDGSILSITTI